jgi:hypothetical protein
MDKNCLNNPINKISTFVQDAVQSQLNLNETTLNLCLLVFGSQFLLSLLNG